MKDSRAGDHLWIEWSYESREFSDPDNLYYYTLGHVTLEEEVVKRALASCLQRDGIVDSLAEGFRVVEDSKVTHGYSGVGDLKWETQVCNKEGETFYGDFLTDVEETTWVQLSSNFQ